MADSTPDPLHVGEIRFYDNAVPELKAGTYTIKVTQEVNGIDFGKIAPPLPQTQKLVVRGPQFHLDPQEIHAMYPPANSTGQFAEVLPHIVLNRRVLPWERQIGGSNSNIPWLALLVFAEGEMIGGDPIFHVSNTTVEVFLAQDQPVLTPALMKEEDISKTDSCQYIQLATATFQQITPRLEEAKYLAHCREINTRDKSSQGTADAGWFAVVVCNRFPVMDANTPWAPGISPTWFRWKGWSAISRIPPFLRAPGRKMARLTTKRSICSPWQTGRLPARKITTKIFKS